MLETTDYDELAPQDAQQVDDLYREFMAEFYDRAEVYKTQLVVLAFLSAADEIASEYIETEH
jgi:hypothetical protein